MGSLISLEDLKREFNNKIVYIPLYQRNYKWPATEEGKKTSAQKLAKDLLKHWNKYRDKENIPSYHLGMLTIYKKKEGGGEYQILDGQQRLITLTLIMKALGEGIPKEWFDLQFERDPGFTTDNNNNASTPRHDFIYNNNKCNNCISNKRMCNNDTEINSIDVKRMCNNFTAINNVINNVINDRNDKEEFYKFIMANVKVLYRETKQEPVEEFLNMNFNKTPFCAADYIKAYMVMDAGEQQKEITVGKIIDLWKRLECVLFQLEALENNKTLENEMYKLVKQNYREDFLEKNRIEMLFQDRYIEIKKKEITNKDEFEYQAYKYKEQSSLETEYNRLIYYYKVMKSVLEELQVVDKNGKKHPNYNAYNAYNLLCKKDGDVHFFKLIDEFENINKNIDVVQIIHKQFNLTETSHDKVNRKNDFNAKNQFMEALLLCENTTDSVNKIEEINKTDYINNLKSSEEELEFFDACYDVFNSCFKEYIELIEKGKNINNSKISKEALSCNDVSNIGLIGQEEECNELLASGKLTLYDLLINSKIKQIKIPTIQRDYVMGSADEYLKKYLQSITFKYRWSQFLLYKKNNENYEYKYEYKYECKTTFTEKGLELFERMAFETVGDDKKIFKNPYTTSNKLNFQNLNKNLANGQMDIPKDFRKKKADEYVAYEEFSGKIIGGFNSIISETKKQYNETKDQSDEKIFQKEFNTSCIMGHLDDNGVFWVYDGQQRLTTSIVLVAYLLRDNNSENKTDDVLDQMYLSIEDKMALKRLLKKFSFEGRDGANRCIDILLDENVKMDYVLEQMYRYIEDKTSFSIYKLIDNYNQLTSNKEEVSICINPFYLLKGMEFEFTQVDSVDDAEQLFMELNEGLKLETYEKYKAEFNYHVGKIFTSDEDNKLEILRKTDNLWLDELKSEQKEIEWLQYCVTMASFEKNGYDSNQKYKSLQNIDQDIISCAASAMDYIVGEDKEIRDTYSNDTNQHIKTWVEILCSENKFQTPLIASVNDRIYFEKNFYDFVELYLAFAQRQDDWENGKANYYSKCFEMIAEFRKNGYLEIPPKEGGDESTEGKLYRQMLTNRQNRFVFDEISKWESITKSNDSYEKNVENNKGKSYAYEITSSDELYTCKLTYDSQSNEGISYETIFNAQESENIKKNIKYYFYNEKKSSVTIAIKMDNQTAIGWISEDDGCSKELVNHLKKNMLLKMEGEKLINNQSEIVCNDGRYTITYKDNTYSIKKSIVEAVFLPKKAGE